MDIERITALLAPCLTRENVAVRDFERVGAPLLAELHRRLSQSELEADTGGDGPDIETAIAFATALGGTLDLTAHCAINYSFGLGKCADEWHLEVSALAVPISVQDADWLASLMGMGASDCHVEERDGARHYVLGW